MSPASLRGKAVAWAVSKRMECAGAWPRPRPACRGQGDGLLQLVRAGRGRSCPGRFRCAGRSRHNRSADPRPCARVGSRLHAACSMLVALVPKRSQAEAAPTASWLDLVAHHRCSSPMTAARAAMTAPAPPPRACLLGGLAMFGPFSIDTIFPAFEHIGARTRRRQGGDAADDQRLPARLCADERGARAAVGCDRTAQGDHRRAGRVRAGVGGLRAVARPADAAGVPRAAGTVGRRRPDRRPRA